MLIENVRSFIEEEKLIKKGDRIVAAVSGGPDSLCLLNLLRELRAELGIEIFVAHLNHQFRQESDEEFLFVRNLAKEWQISFYGGSINVPAYMKKMGLSAQEAARHCRYRFLLKVARYYKAKIIATGHHRDDQVETVILNILRGTGLEGLTGMSAQRFLGGCKVIRPLLQISKKEIVNYCRENGIDAVSDASNFKDIYRRNKIRLQLLPLLAAEYNPAVDEALLRLARSAGEDNDYLKNKANFLFHRFTAKKNRDSIFFHSNFIKELHPCLQRRIIRSGWQKINPGDTCALEAKHVLSIMELYANKGAGKRVSLPHKIFAVNVPGGMIFSREQKTDLIKTDEIILNIPGETLLEEVKIFFRAEITEKEKLRWPLNEKTAAYFDLEKLRLPLIVRCRRHGDIFKPLNMGNKKKKLKDLFIDKKIPFDERDLHPLVLSGNDIIWVTGLAVAHNTRITEKTSKALILKWDFIN